MSRNASCSHVPGVVKMWGREHEWNFHSGLNSLSVLCQRPTAEWCPVLTYFQFSSFSPGDGRFPPPLPTMRRVACGPPRPICVRIKAWTACGLGCRSSWRIRQGKKRLKRKPRRRSFSLPVKSGRRLFVASFLFREGGARSPGDPGCLFQAIVRHLINAAR